MKGFLRMKSNNKGNAALVALLVVIIIICVGATVMVLAGRNSIDDTDKYSSSRPTPNVNSVAPTTSAAEPDKPKEIDLYCKQAPDFKTTSIKGLSAAATILADLDSDMVLAGSNLDAKLYPASLTKIMTILVACENIKSYDDTYTFKEEDFVKLVEEDASMAGFKAGEKVTAKDLLYGAILPSGADATVGLANLVSGSEAEFVKLMNQRAKELGLKNTNFVNASGIHDPNHYTTVNDMLVIMKVANHNVTCRNVMCTFDYTTSRTQQNPDGIHLTCILGGRLQGFYIDKNGNGQNDDTASIEGGKTGFTNESKSCLATLCYDKETDHTYVCIVFKCTNTETSITETLQMYEKYLPGSKAKVADAEPAKTTTATTTTAKAA